MSILLFQLILVIPQCVVTSGINSTKTNAHQNITYPTVTSQTASTDPNTVSQVAMQTTHSTGTSKTVHTDRRYTVSPVHVQSLQNKISSDGNTGNQITNKPYNEVSRGEYTSWLTDTKATFTNQVKRIPKTEPFEKATSSPDTDVDETKVTHAKVLLGNYDGVVTQNTELPQRVTTSAGYKTNTDELSTHQATESNLFHRSVQHTKAAGLIHGPESDSLLTKVEYTSTTNHGVTINRTYNESTRRDSKTSEHPENMQTSTEMTINTTVIEDQTSTEMMINTTVIEDQTSTEMTINTTVIEDQTSTEMTINTTVIEDQTSTEMTINTTVIEDQTSTEMTINTTVIEDQTSTEMTINTTVIEDQTSTEMTINTTVIEDQTSTEMMINTTVIEDQTATEMMINTTVIEDQTSTEMTINTTVIEDQTATEMTINTTVIEDQTSTEMTINTTVIEDQTSTEMMINTTVIEDQTATEMMINTTVIEDQVESTESVLHVKNTTTSIVKEGSDSSEEIKELESRRRTRLIEVIERMNDTNLFDGSHLERFDWNELSTDELAAVLSSLKTLKDSTKDKGKTLSTENLSNVEVISMDKLMVVVSTISAALILFIVIMCIIYCRKGKPENEPQNESMKSDILQLRKTSISSEVSNGKVNSDTFMGIPPNNDIWRELQALPPTDSSVVPENKGLEIAKFWLRIGWLIDWMVFYAAFNSISVISRRQLTLFLPFLGFTSTRIGPWSVLPKDTPTKKKHSGPSAARTQGPWITSQTIYHWATQDPFDLEDDQNG